MANDPEEPAKALPTDEPFEVWWPKYLARVKESVEAAEQHLEVPAGTISLIPGEPDFIATVKTYAVIEPVLNDLIAARPPQPNYLAFGLGFGAPAIADQSAKFRAFVTSLNMSGPTGKLRLAEGLGLLTQGQIEFINGVARVRNRYAHNVKNMHRSLFEMLTEEQTNNAKIVAHVTGMQIRLPSPIFENDFLKAFMYHRLADYLADALHTLRPPPLPGGGLLGGLGGCSTSVDNINLWAKPTQNSTDSSCPVVLALVERNVRGGLAGALFAAGGIEHHPRQTTHQRRSRAPANRYAAAPVPVTKTITAMVTPAGVRKPECRAGRNRDDGRGRD